jgi:hypothetical protein
MGMCANNGSKLLMILHFPADNCRESRNIDLDADEIGVGDEGTRVSHSGMGRWKRQIASGGTVPGNGKSIGELSQR